MGAGAASGGATLGRSGTGSGVREATAGGVGGAPGGGLAALGLLLTAVFVVGVVSTPVGWWRLLAAEGLALAFVLGLSGARPRELFGRWLAFLVLVGFLALP